jgi:serine/threonine-protein kinase
MIPDDHLGLLEAARAIAAGRRVEWDAIESSAHGSESFERVLRQLKIVEGIAELHRSLPTDTPAGSDASSSAEASGETVAAVERATWGSLQLFDRVGRGAYGTVFRAWDPRLDREVALKLLLEPESQRGSVGTLVVDEGRLLARVRHPNVVTVFGADCIDGTVGVWMEFVRGRTLEAVLHENGPLGAQEAVLIGLDVCRALSAVHRAGLVHRDIKAQNVMREDGGRTVLMDFGAGRDVLADRPTDVAGTPLYLPPEVFAGGTATPQSDIYSVGVLLYHLVTASYPVKGAAAAELREAHARRQRSWLRDDRPDLPTLFVETVERALEADVAKRYETAGAMEAALTRVLMNSRTSRRWGTMAMAAAAVLVVSLAVRTLWRVGKSPSFPSQIESPLSGAVPSRSMRRVTLPEFSVIGRPSADGKWMSMADGSGNVAVLDLATGDLRRVTTDASSSARASQGAVHAVVAPDDKSVAFGWHALDGQFELRVVDLDGTHPRVLLRDSRMDFAEPLEWARDGSAILTLAQGTDHSSELVLVSVDDGTVRHVKRFGDAMPKFASLSPDGRYIAYDAPQAEGIAARDIFLIGSDGRDDHPLVVHRANDAQPVWTADGAAVMFASDRTGTNDIWSVRVERGYATGEPALVQRNVGRMLFRGLTKSGSYFYFLTAGAADVFEASIAGGAVGKPRPVSSSYVGANLSSLWSRDGRRLAYASRRGLTYFDRESTTLVIRDLQSGQEREFAPALNGFLLRSWSPDGRHLLVGGTGLNNRSGPFDIDVDSTNVTPAEVGQRPDWMPDGRLTSLAGRQRIVARTPQTGAEDVLLQLHDPEALFVNVLGRGYRVSPNGEMLAFTTEARNGNGTTHALSIGVLRGGPPRELVRVADPELLIFQDWMPDGQSVIFTKWSSDKVSLWRVSIHGGDPEPLGLTMVRLRDVSVHPDGTKITFTAGDPTNELWAIDHLFDER